MAGAALTAVQTQQTLLTGYATEALATANTALESLADSDYTYVTGISNVFAPFNPALPVLPAAPTTLTIGTPPAVSAISIPSPPAVPSITQPSAPTLSTIVVPTAPPVSSITMQNVTAPSIVEVPTMPALANVSIEDLTVEYPAPLSLAPYAPSFTNEDILIRDDPMVSAIMDRITNNLSGGSGLTQEIEDAIFNRDLERNEQTLEDTTDKVISMWAKKGFSLPDGLLGHSLSEVQKEYMNKKIDRSREIAIKQADLEQNNLFKSMEIGASLAFKLIEQLNAYKELVFKIEETVVKYANEYLDMQIKAHNSVIDVLKATVQIHELNIRAQTAKVENYKAQIEGLMAINGVNESNVRLYSAQITAAVEKYRGELSGDTIKAQIFSTQMQGVLAQAQVNESMIKAYAEEIRAGIAQAEVYKAEVEGMTAEIGAQKLIIEANIAQVAAWAKGADAQIATYNSAVEVFKATGQMAIATTELANKTAEVTFRGAIEQSKILTANAQIIAGSIEAAGKSRIAAAAGVAQSASSLAAGAMAAVHAQASMSYAESMPLAEV